MGFVISLGNIYHAEAIWHTLYKLIVFWTRISLITRLKLSIGPNICPWDILLPSLSWCWIKYMKVSFSDFIMTDVEWLRLTLLTLLWNHCKHDRNIPQCMDRCFCLPRRILSMQLEEFKKSQSYLQSHSHTRRHQAHMLSLSLHPEIKTIYCPLWPSLWRG